MKKNASITVTFQLPGYWDRSARRIGRSRRVETGYSSIRVTKATRNALAALARAITREHPGWESGWGNKLPVDELLAAIAAGVVSIGVEKASPPGPYLETLADTNTWGPR
jgi:hypothetical protein